MTRLTSAKKSERFLDFEKLCRMTPKELKKHLARELTKTHKNVIKADGYLYAEGTYPVMLVAHMDTVHKDYHKWFNYEQKGNKISCPEGIGGDDRCGIYMILQVIKEINCSVVFTEDEEIGCVGAGKFADAVLEKKLVPAKVNYIIEFDRRGKDDAVYYYLDNKDFERFVTESSGGYFRTASGSYSDICDIAPVMDVAAVNLSCGYYNEHTFNEYVMKDQMLTNIKKAKMIINTPCENPYAYIEKKYSTSSKWGFGGYYDKGLSRYDYGWDDYDYGWDEVDAYYYNKEAKFAKNNSALYEDEWEIVFIDNTTLGYEQAVDYYNARDYYQALGKFMEAHPTVPFDDVVYIHTTEDGDYTDCGRYYWNGELYDFEKHDTVAPVKVVSNG